MTDALLILLFIAGGYPIAVLLLPKVAAVLAAGACSAVIATFAALVHVATGLPIAWAWGALVVLSGVLVVAVPALRLRALTHLKLPASWQEYLFLGLTAVLILLLVVFIPAPAWDARSIWLFHAKWFTGPPADYLYGVTAPALVFSHSDYPLLVPASIAVPWNLIGVPEDYPLGSRLIAVLTITTVAFAASWIALRSGRRVHPVVAVLVFGGVLTACVPVAQRLLTFGYVDTLQAAFVLAAAVLLLTKVKERMTWTTAAAVSVFALGAANVKQEGVYFALAVVIAYLIATWRSQYVAKYLPLVVVVVGYAAWRGFLRIVDAIDTSDAGGVGGRVGELLDPGSTAWALITRILTQNWRENLLPLTAALLVLLIASVVLERGTLRLVVFVALAFAAVNAVVVAPYALGNTRESIDFWLGTSFNRVIVTAQLLAVLGIAAVVVAVTPWGSRSTPSAPPEPKEIRP